MTSRTQFTHIQYTRNISVLDFCDRRKIWHGWFNILEKARQQIRIHVKLDKDEYELATYRHLRVRELKTQPVRAPMRCPCPSGYTAVGSYALARSRRRFEIPAIGRPCGVRSLAGYTAVGSTPDSFSDEQFL